MLSRLQQQVTTTNNMVNKLTCLGQVTKPLLFNELITTRRNFLGSLTKERDEEEREEKLGVRQMTEKEIKDSKESIFAGVARVSDMVLTSGKGLYVYDIYGNKYLDFTSGIGALSTGHCHPKVTEAVIQQAGRLVHSQIGIAHHETILKLVQKLKGFFPSQLNSYFFWNSGSEAVEAAIKVARLATKKPNIICFQGGYHGRTFGAMAMTTSKNCFTTGVGPLPTGFIHAPYPYMGHMPKGITSADMSDYCIEEMERILLQKTTASDTAAVIIEPILGEGGYVVPPSDFLFRLKKICEKNNMLLICDEVQTGFGRTGTMFAFEHFGIVPDIVTIAKGFGSGYPISGIVTRKELSDLQPPGSMGGTYAGNAVACAAALATLEIFEEEKLVENSIAKGKRLRKGLDELAKKGSYNIKEVRGLGLMQAIEFDHKVVPKGTAYQIIKELQKEKMISLTSGAFETLRFVPSLTINDEEVDEGLDKLNKVFKRVFN